MLGNFAFFLSIFSVSFFATISFRNTFSVNSLHPDQALQNVGSNLDPNCLQRLSEDDKNSFEWVKS